MSVTNIDWQDGTPPRRGVYRVRSATGRNPGYRYWDGERWGNLCYGYSHALKIKTTGRRSQIPVAVQWGSKPAVAFIDDERTRLRRALEWVLDNPVAHPANRAKVIEAALK